MSATKSPYHRYSDWAETLSFSLNVSEGNYDKTIDFLTEEIFVRPMVFEFYPSGLSPSGSRHLQTHNSFKRIVASGNGDATLTFNPIDYGSINIGQGSGISNTTCVIFRINEFELNTTRVHNIKFWNPDYSDFLYPQYAKVIYEVANDWTQNKTLSITGLLDKTKWISETLPENQNIFRASGIARTIYGTNDDHVSQYLYLALVSSGTTPLGEYGNVNTSTSGFNLRFTYNFDNIVPLRD